MTDFYRLWQEIDRLEHGAAAMAAYKKAFTLADQEKNHYFQIVFRYAYNEEAVFYDDSMMMYVVFPEMLKIYDEYVKTGNMDEELTHDILMNYKWVLENSKYFHQISAENIESFLEDFKRRCLEHGFSLRPYHQYRCFFYDLIDEGIAEESYRNFLRAERDELCDCEACEQNLMVFYLLRTKKDEEALNAAKPLLNGTIRCKEVPELTYGSLLLYYLSKDQRKQAAGYGKKIKNSIQKKGIGKEFIGSILLFYAIDSVEDAFSYYKKNHMWAEKNKNPYQKFYFYLAASLLWMKIGEKEIIKMKLSKECGFYDPTDCYQKEQLFFYYHEEALRIARNFDARNENLNFEQMLLEVLEKQQVMNYV